MKLKTILYALLIASLPSALMATPNNDLLEAVMWGDVEQVQKSLNAGANPEATDQFDYPALYLAVEKDNLAMVKALLDAGANPWGLVTFPGQRPIPISQIARCDGLNEIAELIESYQKFSNNPHILWDTARIIAQQILDLEQTNITHEAAFTQIMSKLPQYLKTKQFETMVREQYRALANAASYDWPE